MVQRRLYSNAKHDLISDMEALSSPPEQSQPSEPSPRRKRRRREIRSGKLSVKLQIGIILAAVGLVTLILLAFMGLIGRPAQAAQVDQTLIDSRWNP